MWSRGPRTGDAESVRSGEYALESGGVDVEGDLIRVGACAATLGGEEDQQNGADAEGVVRSREGLRSEQVSLEGSELGRVRAAKRDVVDSQHAHCLSASCDGKGVGMRPDALRAATAQATARSTTKLATRLSNGEKRNRKRMAEVGSVYDAPPVPRTPDDVLADSHDGERRAARRASAQGALSWMPAPAR